MHRTGRVKIKLKGNRLHGTNSAKCPAIRVVNKSNWEVHNDNIAIKLIRASATLYKIRDYVTTGILK